MPHFCGHTHTRRDRRDSSLAERGNILERLGVLGVEPAVLPAGTPSNAVKVASTQHSIAELAYSYWAARGYQGGSDREDWFRAERELRERGNR
jgi:hypothetical protein